MAVGRSVRSARSVLFIINLICGFLFVLVFEMLFGWQMMRPEASQVFFENQLSALAARQQAWQPNQTRLEGPRLTLRERSVITFARDFVIGTLQLDSSSVAALRHQSVTRRQEDLLTRIHAYTTQQPIFEREEMLSGFHDGLKACSLMVHSVQDSVLKKSVSHTSAPDSLIASVAEMGMVRDPSIAHALQEIEDRYEVNASSRGRRVGPRVYAIPLIGIPIQLEDISLPVAVIVLLLTFWLRSYVGQVCEAVQICRSELGNRFSVVARQIAGTFFFLRWRANGEGGKAERVSFKHRIIILFMTPYIVLSSGIIANLYEILLLDHQFHGTWSQLDTSLFASMVFFETAMVAICIALQLLAVKMTKDIWAVWEILNRHLPYWSRSDVDVQGEIDAVHWKGRRNILRNTLAPLAFLTAFFALRAIGHTMDYDYFLPLGSLVLFAAITVVIGMFMWTPKNRSRTAKTGPPSTDVPG